MFNSVIDGDLKLQQVENWLCARKTFQKKLAKISILL
jgi:hypothetical protein